MTFEISLESSLESIQEYLLKKEWIRTEDVVISIEKPGEGNMNVVLRVETTQTQLILKQARSFVNKYPQIPAPIERISVESQFYDLVSDIEKLHQFMPKLIGFDAENYILAVEDLGVGADYSQIYQKGNTLSQVEIESAIEYLSILHNIEFFENIIQDFPDNLSLRKLNHEHLFNYPYMIDNGFDLDTIQSGLQAVAMRYKIDEVLKTKINELGNTYLSAGNVLLHGDYYPGSWLKVGEDFKVIDPEFCFFGCAEYDLGVMIAHLKMAQIIEKDLSLVLQHYIRPNNFSEKLMKQFIGMEILRRIIGLAQLPLDLTLEEKQDLLEEAVEFVKNAS